MLGWYKLRETGPTDATGNNCYNYDGVLAIDDSSVVLIKEFKGASFLIELVSGQTCTLYESVAVERGDATVRT